MQNVFDTKVFKVLSKGKGDISYGWKGAGVAVPVFSLKSNNSFGIGEFLDLKLLADWCNKVGLKMIQILPINDTRTDGSWDNSYPYKAISTKALHPIYLNLDIMGQLVDENDREYFKQQKEILNAKDYVDYPEVMKVKEDYFRKIFLQTWNDTKEREDYKTFFNENKDWLMPYASFCSQRDYETTSRDASMIPAISTNIDTSTQVSESITEFSYFLQYHLDKQLKEAVDYLHERGIALKGDIPIGIGRDSVEAYTNPELFNLDSQAGAPPDAFATEGQNWGFPTYNWEEMAKYDYKWWRERLTHMSRYFDAYRIDHILGFFRIWEIPIEYSQGTMGHFSPALPLELGIETQSHKDADSQILRFSDSQILKIVPILSLILVLIISPPDSIYRMIYSTEKEISTIDLEESFDEVNRIGSGEENENGSFSIGDKRRMLVIVSSGCKYCKLGVKKLSMIMKREGYNTDDVDIFIWGSPDGINDFRKETMTEDYRYWHILPNKAIDITYGRFPVFIRFDKKEIVKIGDFRDLDDDILWSI